MLPNSCVKNFLAICFETEILKRFQVLLESETITTIITFYPIKIINFIFNNFDYPSHSKIEQKIPISIYILCYLWSSILITSYTQRSKHNNKSCTNKPRQAYQTSET